MALMVGKNVYYNMPYKHLGPEMNKMTAVARCNRLGFEAFWDELRHFGTEKAR
jgi:hypothetical protein